MILPVLGDTFSASEHSFFLDIYALRTLSFVFISAQ